MVEPERSRTPAQRLGDRAEDGVAAALRDAGWTIVGRNVHVGRAELDLIARDPGPPPTLVFVEVRWRAGRDFGLAEETVDRHKRQRIQSAAFRWLDEADPRPPRLPLRFDLVVVEPGQSAGAGRVGPPRIRHHRAAF
jgi:putative endonuclease